MAERSSRTQDVKEPRQRSHDPREEDREDNGRSASQNGERKSGSKAREQVTQAADRGAEASRRSIDRLQRAFGAFWEEAGQDDYGPIMRNVARANLELIGWMGRRAQAAAEMPSHLVRCQTPREVLGEQERFMRDMMRDFQGLTTRMLDLWTEGALPDRHKGERK